MKDLNWQKCRETLEFIDEIQEIHGALNQQRYFQEAHPEIPLISFGSRLEILLKQSTQIPVGRIRVSIRRTT